MPVEERKSALRQADRAFPHRPGARHADQAGADRVLPDGHARTRGVPRIHGLTVASGTVGNPGQELQGEGIHGANYAPRIVTIPVGASPARLALQKAWETLRTGGT